MFRILFVIFLLTSSFFVAPKSLSSQASKILINLSSPENTIKTCWAEMSQKNIKYLTNICTTKKSQIKLSSYFYWVASLHAGIHGIGNQETREKKYLDTVKKRYKLSENFRENNFEQIDNVGLISDLYGYFIAFTDTDEQKDKEWDLINLKIEGNRASGLIVQKNATTEQTEWSINFLRVENHWLIDGWNNF